MEQPERKPVLTIVTVVWNNIEGLKQTTDSIQQQNYEAVEHVVIDGYSTDGTREWLRNYKPNYAVRFISEPDDGIYDAMNKGMKLASGEYIQFLNGGDALASQNVLAEVEKSWRENKWDWAYGGIKYIDENRRPIREYQLSPFSRRRVSRGLAFVPHPSTYASRELLLQLGGFDSKFGFSADQELAVRMSLTSKPYELKKVLVEYLIVGAHGASSYLATSRRYQQIRFNNHLVILGSTLIDNLYTSILALFWTMRPKVRAAIRTFIGNGAKIIRIGNRSEGSL